jgi:transposase
MVSKCGDSIPLYRSEKQYKRAGLKVSRATTNELLHRHAELLLPLCDRLFQRIAEDEVVLADETTIKLIHQSSKAWIWALLSGNLIGYRFSRDRSEKTPREVLGYTTGTFVVDAYTGYNAVTGVDRRTRAGCLAHARRIIFEARAADSSADEALAAIQRVYRVEHDAKEQGLAQSDEHLALRKKRSGPAMDELHMWLTAKKSEHTPRSAMGRGIRYALKNWVELTRFLEDARIPVDNNRSEGALRVIALGRKNFLFVGTETAGINIAGLYSLIATCDACGVNPLEYLADVMRRVSSHPASQIGELLPNRWKPAT